MHDSIILDVATCVYDHLFCGPGKLVHVDTIDHIMQRAANRIEQIAENRQLDDDVRIQAHLLFGEFYSITNPGTRRITLNAKRDLLKRMKRLINEHSGSRVIV